MASAQPSPENKKPKATDTAQKIFIREIDKDDQKGIRFVDQDIPEKDKDPQWFIDNIHSITTFYNVAFESVLVPTGSNQSYNGTPATPLNPRDLPVQRMLRNMTYYQGKQENLEYADWTSSGADLTTGNVDYNNYQARWIKGQDISELLNFMKGNMLERIVNLQITAKALSENAASLKEDYRTKLMMKYKYHDIFAELQQQGVEFNVGPKEGFDSEEAIDNFMEKKYKQQGVDVAVAMAKDVWYKQFGIHKMLDSFLKLLITGTAQIQQYVQNGKLFWRPLPSYQMIFDTRHDDDYNRDAQFIGIVETMTPTEIFSRYPQLNKEQRDEIKKMARTKELGSSYNSGNANFLWWNYNIKRDECVISVVTAYWMGRHDMGLKKTKDKFDVDRIMKVVKGEDETGDYVIDDIYKGTLIGNRYLLDFGLDDNIVEDPFDKSKPMFSIIRYMPNMVGGEPRAIVSRLADMQDEIDALKFKVREIIGRAKGKCYIIRGDLGNDTTLQEIYKDWGAMGLAVIPLSGENAKPGDNKLLEMADFTLDPNIMRLEEVVKINRDLMKEYASISSVSLGQQTTYMGMGERNAAIGQSTYGIAALYSGFMDFIQMNLQYSINVQKSLLTMDGNDTEAAFEVGDKGVLFLKVMKDMKFEDFRIMLQLNDAIDEAGRKELQQLGLGWVQGGVLSPDSWLKIRRQETFSGAEKAIEYEVKKKEKKDAALRQEQAQQAQQLQAQQGDALQKAEMMRQAGQDHRQNIQADAKKEVALIQKTPEPHKDASQ